MPEPLAHLPTDHAFVLGGIDFLRDVRSGEAVRVGPRVVVVGRGDDEMYHHGFIVADSKTLMTDEPGVLAGGDARAPRVRPRSQAGPMAALLERQLCQTCARGRGDRPHIGATPSVAAPVMDVLLNKE